MESFKFKKQHTLEERKTAVEKIRALDKIPVIVERARRSRNVPDIEKHAFQVPKEITVGQFVKVIREKIKLDSKQAMFVLVNNVLPSTGSLMSTIYDEHKDEEDGFVYLKYSGENVFGGSQTDCIQE